MASLSLNIGAQQVQKQSLVITPQLQHAISILQMNNVELEKHLEELSESNPFLEVKACNSEAKKKVEIDYRPPSTNGSSISGSFLDNLLGEKPVTLVEYINKQLGLERLCEKQEKISERILMDLSAAGYFVGEMETISEQLGVSIHDVENVLKRLQKLEPIGIFARSLSECLKLQAIDRGELSSTMTVVIDNLELLAKGQFKELCTLASCSGDEIKETAKRIRHYDPKPGSQFEHNPIENQREPDLLVSRNGDTIEISLNRSSLPSVSVNLEYAKKLKKITKPDNDSEDFIKNSVATGHWLARAIAQRNQTLQSVASFILRHQFGFFDKGVEAIRPLQLRVVADALNIHESTVSRSTASVLIQTPRGTFPLKMFFSSGLQADENSEGVSARAIRLKIKEIIAKENPLKPISDSKISSSLLDDGYKVARRTVAKYRELEGLKSTANRKREHKLKTLIED